jgi:hypothetical protein
MNCDKCESERILRVYGKCSDLCVLQFKDSEKEGYVESDCGIGGGDDIDFNLCLECGKVQGEFPLPDPDFCQEDEEDW